MKWQQDLRFTQFFAAVIVCICFYLNMFCDVYIRMYFVSVVYSMCINVTSIVLGCLCLLSGCHSRWKRCLPEFSLEAQTGFHMIMKSDLYTSSCLLRARYKITLIWERSVVWCQWKAMYESCDHIEKGVDDRDWGGSWKVFSSCRQRSHKWSRCQKKGFRIWKPLKGLVI